MLNSPPALPPAAEAETIERTVRAGPKGAIALAATTTAIVILLWFAFYFIVFLPRGTIQ